MIIRILKKYGINVQMIDLNIKVAKLKFKKLGVINFNSWVMLVNPNTRKSYIYLNVINHFKTLYLYIIYQSK
jgi:hypothetical protein